MSLITESQQTIDGADRQTIKTITADDGAITQTQITQGPDTASSRVRAVRFAGVFDAPGGAGGQRRVEIGAVVDTRIPIGSLVALRAIVDGATIADLDLRQEVGSRAETWRVSEANRARNLAHLERERAVAALAVRDRTIEDLNATNAALADRIDAMVESHPLAILYRARRVARTIASDLGAAWRVFADLDRAADRAGDDQ